MISYSEVIKCIEDYYRIGYPLLDTLEKKIVKGRDRIKDSIPIYLTKRRIKTPDSTYLKIKRNNIKNLMEITDIAGLRIICLFEQDIIPTHGYILKVIKPYYKLKEFILFSYQKNKKDRKIAERLTEKLKEFYPCLEPQYDAKASGYKSVHYILETISGPSKEEYKTYNIEIQLRTLFQDAWAELEHRLSYKKGYVHTYITKSFNLLAKDLENNDSLISHLKDISDKEESLGRYSFESIGPLSWFNYPDEMIPEKFLEDELRDKYNAYVYFIQGKNPKIQKKEWLGHAWELYYNFKDSIPREIRGEVKVKYWVDMEEAYLNFCEGKYKDAEDTYLKCKKGYPTLYLIDFRLGEIYLIKREIVESLKCFDNVEKLIKKHSDYVNIYRVKVKLAYIYWYLSEKFIDISINEINEAKYIFNKNQSLFKEKYDYRSLANNLSYYYLQKYIIINREYQSKEFKDPKDEKNKLIEVENAYNDVLNEFNNLEKYLSEKWIPSNLCDTAAWVYYQRYLKENNLGFLKKAQNLTNKIFDRVNLSVFSILSLKLQLNHLQEIVTTTKKVGLL